MVHILPQIGGRATSTSVPRLRTTGSSVFLGFLPPGLGYWEAPGCLKNAQKLLHSRLMDVPRQVLVYTRKGCHLCEIVKESIVKLARRGGFVWREVDVDTDEQLRRQFNDEVPVVFIDGRKAFKYRMDEREFLRKLVS